MTKERLKDYAVKVTQANRVELIVIMYDVAIEYIEDSIACYGKNTEEFRLGIKRARSIISELSASLDMQYEISGQLLQVYMFLNRALLQCDIRNEAVILPRLTAMLENLKSSFVELSKTVEEAPVMENTQQVYAGRTYSKSSWNENMYSDSNRGFTV